MGIDEAIKIVKEFQLWRRGIDEGLMPYSPKEFGIAIDVLLNLAQG